MGKRYDAPLPTKGKALGCTRSDHKGRTVETVDMHTTRLASGTTTYLHIDGAKVSKMYVLTDRQILNLFGPIVDKVRADRPDLPE